MKYQRGSIVVLKRFGRIYEGIIKSHNRVSNNVFMLEALIIDGIEVIGGHLMHDAHDNYVIEVKRVGYPEPFQASLDCTSHTSV